MRVQLLVRPYYQTIGLARYTESLCRAMAGLDVAYAAVAPSCPWFMRYAQRVLGGLGFDVQTFLTTYPLAAPVSRDAVTHLTAQQMASLLWLRRGLGPTVVTVHDIVPFLVRRDKEQRVFRHPVEAAFDRAAVSGLKHADALISDSEFTKRTVVDAAHCAADKVHVVPLGVEHDLFHPAIIPREFHDRYQLEPGLRYVLYVGSANPRKNLERLVRAFAQVHEACPDVRLLKVGPSHYAAHEDRLRDLIQDLGLGGAVLFYDRVPDQDLALFYNVADLFCFPSLWEGFGLPPLEAMACGTPVVCSSAASLPEVVGEAALVFDPLDIDAQRDAMHRVLSDQALREDLRARGMARAKQFSWERTARETLAVYQKVSDMRLACGRLSSRGDRVQYAGDL